MGKLRVRCDDCGEVLDVHAHSAQEDLRSAGWYRVGDQTYCPLCAIRRGLSVQAASEPSANAEAESGSADECSVELVEPGVGPGSRELEERAASGETGLESAADIYLPAARHRALRRLLALSISLLAFTAWLASLALKGGDAPSLAGLTWLAGSAVAGLYAGMLAVRAANCRVTADSAGIVIHNIRNDLRVPWTQVSSFDLVTTGIPAWSTPDTAFAVQVTLADGRTRLLDATRRPGRPSTATNREEAVTACVGSLRWRASEHGVDAGPGRAVQPRSGRTTALLAGAAVLIVAFDAAVASTQSRVPWIYPVAQALVGLIGIGAYEIKERL